MSRRALAVLVVGLLITVVGTLLARSDTTSDLQERLEERADRVVVVLSGELDRFSSASRAAAALRADDPSLATWVVRVERLGIAEDLASVFSVASATLRGSGEDRALVIDLVAPVEPNEAALGLDLLTVPLAEPAVRRAVEDERASLSEALTLVQETEDQTGLVVYAPWYAEDGSVGGVTDLVVRGQDLVDALAPELGDVGLRIVDPTPEGAREIGRLVPEAGLDEGFVAVRQVDLLGQTWDVEVTAAAGFVSPTERRSTLLVFLALLTVTGLVTALVQVLARREEHARAEVEARTAELVTANEDLERALRAKDEFLAVVTHEFRTPITVIRGFAEVARSGQVGEVPAEVSHLLQRIDQHAKRLHALVDNVLTAARLQVGDLVVETETVDVGVLVRAAADQHHHLEPLEVDVEADLFAEVDPVHLVRVLDGLLTNADKYGHPPVTVTGWGDGDQVVLVVADEGDGVPPDVAARIFEPFEQADSGDTRRSRGVGLGLAVVRQLCARMGGSVTLLDGPGGARFEVRIPRASGPSGPQGRHR